MGEELAAQYLLAQGQRLAELAAATRPNLEVEAVREQVGFVFVFFGKFVF